MSGAEAVVSGPPIPKYTSSLHVLSLVEGAGNADSLGPQLILHRINEAEDAIVEGPPIAFDLLVDEIVGHIDGREKADLTQDEQVNTTQRQFAIKDFDDIRKIITDVLVSDVTAVRNGDSPVFSRLSTNLSGRVPGEIIRSLQKAFRSSYEAPSIDDVVQEYVNSIHNRQLRSFVLGMLYDSIDPSLLALSRNESKASFVVNGSEIIAAVEKDGEIYVNLPDRKFKKRAESVQVYGDVDVHVVGKFGSSMNMFMGTGSTLLTTQVVSTLRRLRSIWHTIANDTQVINADETRADALSIQLEDEIISNDIKTIVGLTFEGYPAEYPKNVDILGEKGAVKLKDLTRTVVSIPKRVGRVKATNTAQLDIDELEGDLSTANMGRLQGKRIKGNISLTDTNHCEIDEAEGDLTCVRSNGVVKRHSGGEVHVDRASKLQVNPTQF